MQQVFVRRWSRFFLRSALLSAFLFSPVWSEETLTVFVREGLVLRESPTLKGKKLSLIPFGTSIQVSEADKPETITVQGITDKFVQTTYGGKTGFVFRGFLSRLPAAPKGTEYVEDYFERVFGPGKRENLKPSPEDHETRKTRVSLRDGIAMTHTVYLGGGFHIIDLPERYDIREIYLLFTAIEKTFRGVKFDASDNDHFECRVYLEGGQSGPVLQFSVTREDGRIRIVFGGST